MTVTRDGDQIRIEENGHHFYLHYDASHFGNDGGFVVKSDDSSLPTNLSDPTHHKTKEIMAILVKNETAIKEKMGDILDQRMHSIGLDDTVSKGELENIRSGLIDGHAGVDALLDGMARGAFYKRVEIFRTTSAFNSSIAKNDKNATLAHQEDAESGFLQKTFSDAHNQGEKFLAQITEKERLEAEAAKVQAAAQAAAETKPAKDGKTIKPEFKTVAPGEPGAVVEGANYKKPNGTYIVSEEAKRIQQYALFAQAGGCDALCQGAPAPELSPIDGKRGPLTEGCVKALCDGKQPPNAEVLAHFDKKMKEDPAFRASVLAGMEKPENQAQARAFLNIASEADLKVALEGYKKSFEAKAEVKPAAAVPAVN